jgi:hypothetical protein
MSDETSAPTLDDLRGITDHVRFILDAKACAKRADELIGLTIAAQEAQAAAEKAQGSLAGARAEHDAACAEREAQAAEQIALASNRQAEADRKEARLNRIAKDIGEAEDRFKRELMRFGHLDVNFNDRLQSMPSYGALADALLDKPAPLDPRVEADELEHIPVENSMAGSTVSRSGKGHRSIPRRVEG